MRRLRRLLIHLYPRSWRERYASEFNALLEDSPAHTQDLIDIVRGALGMHIAALFRKPAWTVILFCAMIGAVTGGIAAWVMPRRYVSSATFTVDGQQPESSRRVSALYAEATNRQYLTSLITQHDLYARERMSTPMESVVDIMRRKIFIRVPSGRASTQHSAFTVRFEHVEPRTAQRVADNLVSRVARLNAERPGLPMTVSVMDRARLPITPVYPNVRNIVAAGSLTGLIVGVLLTAFAFRGRPWRHDLA